MSIKNFKLTIQYDGTCYSGWQIQKDQNTIQGVLKSCIETIIHKDNINVIGSGRTDSGVHSLGQVANFKINTNMSTLNLKNAMNSNLPKDIQIFKSEIVNNDFHSRFSAKEREYIYRIKKKHTPFDYKYHWLYGYDIDIDILNQCADIVLDNKDFSNFCKHSQDIDDYTCLIYNSSWSYNDDILEYRIKANRFLHHMVRMLVGTMLEVSRKHLKIEDFTSFFSDDCINKRILTAPSKGLYLLKVYYE